jgi:hypothetical protein
LCPIEKWHLGKMLWRAFLKEVKLDGPSPGHYQAGRTARPFGNLHSENLFVNKEALFVFLGQNLQIFFCKGPGSKDKSHTLLWYTLNSAITA